MKKAFRIDWYPGESLIGLSKLQPVEIAVLVQICNLIYVQNGPIENDPKQIGRYCSLGRKRAKRIITDLILIDEIYLTANGKISKHKCERSLEDFKKRTEEYSKNGKNGANKRWENKENQSLGYSDAIEDKIANTKTNQIISSSPSPTKVKYRIDHHLDDKSRQAARDAAAGWDLYYLMEVYDEWVNEKGDEIHYHGKAFICWIRRFTKDQTPEKRANANWH